MGVDSYPLYLPLGRIRVISDHQDLSRTALSKTPAEPTDAGREEEGTASLYEPHTTDDGVVVPPPTRPMGPRRLARYYDEVADYLRAVERGDEELPEAPMFMGKVEGLDVPAQGRSLESLTAMGSIDSGETAAEADPFALDVDFDDTRATVVEDPQADIVRQIFADTANPEPATAENVDFASSAGDIEGDADFVALDALATEAAETEIPEADPVEEPAEDSDDSAGGQVTEAPEADSGEGSNKDAIAAIIARAQKKDALKAEPESAPAEEPQGTPSNEKITVTGLFAGTKDAPAAHLPQPVSAVEAQGLDLTPLDDVTDPATPGGSQDHAGAVNSDSSTPVQAAPASSTDGGLETGSDTGVHQVAEPTVTEVSQDETPVAEETPDLGEVAAAQEPAGYMLAEDSEAGNGYATELVEDGKKSGTAAITIGILVLLVLLILVWVFLLQ